MDAYPILFVDDDQQILEIVTAYLTRFGYPIDTVSSGTEAIDKVAEKDYVVVFTDLIMPEISGLDLLKSIKKAAPSTEVSRMLTRGASRASSVVCESASCGVGASAIRRDHCEPGSVAEQYWRLKHPDVGSTG